MPIVAIGGGELEAGETLPIDRRIVELTGRARPRLLFISTASGDPAGYADTVRAVYGDRLGCRVSVLAVARRTPIQGEVAELVDGADAVYVGGGNTLRMMRRWRRFGVDRALLRAHRRGAVLSGLSAGALCWFAAGHSDSLSFTSPDRWDYIAVTGLGLIPALGCPHLDGERRERHFRAMVAKRGGVGLGLTDHAALEVVDGACRVLAARRGAHLVRLRRGGGRVAREEVHPGSVVALDALTA